MRVLILLGLLFLLCLPSVWAEADVTALLRQNWLDYKENFIQADGRVIDHRENITTSEGQSYAMLRAFWMRDQATFDKTYEWAVKNLQTRKNDRLFAWKWGQLKDGSWGVLDQIAASDADQDIALALLLAYEVWPEERYREDALALLADIWDRETHPSVAGRLLLPGDWGFDHTEVRINPSYFAPYAYRVFAEADPTRPWKELVQTSYQITEASLKKTLTHLPPDWVSYDLESGETSLYTDPYSYWSDYGYEAIRVYWRFALDQHLIAPKELHPLFSTTHYLPTYWQIHQDLPGLITWNGVPRSFQIESAAVYGAALPGIYYQDPDAAQEIIDQKIIPNLKPGGPWNTQNDYYTQNWLWFGLALLEKLQKPLISSGSVTQDLVQLFMLDEA